MTEATTITRAFRFRARDDRQDMGLFSSPIDRCAESLLAKDLSDRTAIVTGATGSFGRLVTEQLLAQGAHVVLAVRDVSAGCEVAAALRAKGLRGTCAVAPLDLSCLDSIIAFASRFAAEHSTLHLLVENAAVCCVGTQPTAAGFEPHLGVNHYGHFLLRHRLEPLLAASAPSRVVTVASALHDRLFTLEPTTLDLGASPLHLGLCAEQSATHLRQWMAYARSKLANVLSAAAAGPRLSAKGVTIVSVHPGVDASTGLFRSMPWGAMVMRALGRLAGVQSTWDSVQTILHCSLEEAGALTPGAFYSQFYKAGYRDGRRGGWPMASPNPLVNAVDAARLEALSYAVLGLDPPDGAAGGKRPDAAAHAEHVGSDELVHATPLQRDVVATATEV